MLRARLALRKAAMSSSAVSLSRNVQAISGAKLKAPLSGMNSPPLPTTTITTTTLSK